MTQQQRPVPPQDLAAEQGVLGACLAYGRDVVSLVSPLLGFDGGHFAVYNHGRIWSAMANLWDRGKPVDEITVTSYLRNQGFLDQIGGPVFLAELADLALAPAHAEHYARLVRDKSTLRELAVAASRIERLAYDGGLDPANAVAQAQALVNRLSQGATLGELQSTAEVLEPVYAAYQDRRASGGKDDRALPTGWPRLDMILGGLRPGKLIIPAGRPGMGKTSWMLNLAANVAVRQGKTVLFATKEQPPMEMVDWLICSEGQINTTAWSAGRTKPEEHRSAEVRREVLEKAPLYWLRLRERGDRALRSINSNARYLQSVHGLALVVVDYIQIVSRTRTKHEDISEISSGLKELALELEVPVVAASQLGRQVEERDDHKPKLSDLKGSGSLEEDADVALLFYRPAYYDKASQSQAVEIGVAKHRGGPTGRIDLMFDAPCVRFWDETNYQPPQVGQRGMF